MARIPVVLLVSKPSIEQYFDSQKYSNVTFQLDLFDDEGIMITESIKTLRDPAKVFSPFTQTFSVPASYNNQQVFQYWEQHHSTGVSGNIVNFDSRFSLGARILINGELLEDGVITLERAVIKNGRVDHYVITFQGTIKELRDIFKDDDLSSLIKLSELNHEYNDATVLTMFQGGMNAGFAPSATAGQYDICYPLLMHTKELFYDIGGGGGLEVVDEDGNEQPAILDRRDFKPAVKVSKIVEAIVEKYSDQINLDFSNLFGQNTHFDRLYMWMHRDQGEMNGVGAEQFVDITTQEFTAFGGNTFYWDPITQTFSYPDIGEAFYRFTPSDITAPYKAEIINANTGDVIASIDNIFGASEITGRQTNLNPVLRITSYGDIASITIDEFRIRWYDSVTFPGSVFGPIDSFGLITALNPFAVFNNLDVRSQIPKQTITDFIRGLVNMFNLVAYYDRTPGQKKAVFLTYDQFYGQLGDMFTPTVDQPIKIWDYPNSMAYDYDAISSHIYRRVDFRWSASDTFLIRERNRIVNSEDNYGELSYDDEGKLFSGQDFKIELPFEKMLFSRLGQGGNLTGIISGSCIDKDKSPYVGDPILFYVNNRTITQNIPFDDNLVAVGSAVNVNQYNAPLNTDLTSGQTINWGAEIGESTLVLEENSLFKTYWEEWIRRVFDPAMRIYKVKTKMPIFFNTNFRLWHIVRFRGINCLVNQYDFDVTTGEGEMELSPVLSTAQPINIEEPEEEVQNTPPVAVNDAFTVQRNSSTVLDILANDFDPDGNPLGNITIIDLPDHGTVSTTPEGFVTYTHDGGTDAADSFSYVVSDGRDSSNKALVSITIVNTPPVAVDDFFSVYIGQSIEFNVMLNDYDSNGDALSEPTTLTQPLYGTLEYLGSGNYRYTHDDSQNFTDSFTYRTDDGISNSNTATVTISVVDLGIFLVSNLYNIEFGSTNTFDVKANDIIPQGVRIDDLIITTPPSGGKVSVDSNLNVIYTHTGPDASPDGFFYTLRSGDVLAQPTFVNIFVSQNQPPVAVNDSATISRGGATTINVLANDYDPEGQALSNVTIVSQPTHGTVSVNPSTGVVTYTHNNNGATSDSFTYTMQDAAGAVSNIATVNITISNQNRAPVAVNDSVSIAKGQSLVIAVLANDYDLDGDVLSSPTIVSQPSSGSVIVNANKTVTYTHNNNSATSDSFTYRTSDGFLNSNIATVNIAIEAPTEEIECTGNLDYSGAFGVYVFNVDFGTATGACGIEYETFKQPDRIQIFWDGKLVSDTGYVGKNVTDQWPYDGEFMPSLKPYSNVPVFTLSSGSFVNSGQTENFNVTLADFPDLDLGSGQGRALFYKDKSTPNIATFKIYGPLATTVWELEGICPYDSLACGTRVQVSDTKQAERDYFIDMGTASGLVSIEYSIQNSPFRLEAFYEKRKVADTLHRGPGLYDVYPFGGGRTRADLITRQSYAPKRYNYVNGAYIEQGVIWSRFIKTSEIASQSANTNSGTISFNKNGSERFIRVRVTNLFYESYTFSFKVNCIQ